MFDLLYEHTLDILRYLVQTPTMIGERFFIGFVATFMLLGFVAYRQHYRGEAAGFFAFLFPKRIYTHPSARIDYAIYVINLFVSPAATLFGVALQTTLSISIGNALVELNGGQPIVRGPWSAGTYAAFILGFTVVADLSVYLFHRLHHAWPVLWPLHALHHSAEVMTPVTLFRKHPLWNFTSNLFTKAATGVFQGIFIFVYFGNPGAELLFGLNTLYVVYNFCGSNLRHSHVWLSWGKPLSHIFISPAMHQIHHDPTRMRKNYGEIFAIWDWLFGTLYVPSTREQFDIGLGADTPNPHTSVARAYYVPIVDLGKALLAMFRRRQQA